MDNRPRWSALGSAVILASLLVAAPMSAQTEAKPPEEKASKPWATFAPDLVILGDYTWFSQDKASISQVGKQDSQFEFRADRLMLHGNLFNNGPSPWHYLISLEYHGVDGGHLNEDLAFYDYAIAFPAGAIGEVTVGKMKETFSYEVVGDSASLPHVERIQQPFFATRSVGVRVDKVLPGERGTLAAGVFNDWFDKHVSYNDSRWDFTARATAVPVWEFDGRRFLHVGASIRYQGADQGVVRLKGQPESHVASNYVDTGIIPATHANNVGTEVLWNEKSVSVLGEYIESWVSSDTAGDPRFHGWYVTGSWIITGETRPYDRHVGYARKVTPKNHWGAVEIVARHESEDLKDKSVDGGHMVKWYAGVNYYPTHRLRVSLGTGRTTLDKSGVVGNTRQTFARVQWVY